MADCIRKTLVAAVLPLSFFLVLPPSLAQAPPPGDAMPAPNFWVDMSCSATQPGLVTAAIKWRGSASQPGRSGASPSQATPVLVRVDVATSPTGLERKVFVTVYPQRPSGRPALGAGAGVGAKASFELDPLNTLRVSPQTSRTLPRNRSSLGPASPARTVSAPLQTEGLKPGIDYYFQVRSRTPQGQVVGVVHKLAPSCPADRPTSH